VSQLIEAGIQAIEIPLNSPSPFQSIEIAAKLAGTAALIGAGTVLEPEDVDRLHDAGGRLMVSPNVAPATLTCAVNLGMVTMPGVFTATEALLAAKLGASALKFFPAFKLGPDGIAAIKVILPKDARVAAVGGVSEANFGEYLAEGIEFFGLGSSLYKPGRSPEDVGARARSIVKAYEAAKGSLAA
jgi:2-dehydro-3-deoxyphosphogalactonate aldolase